MGIVSWIIVGLIAGALGKLLMPGDDPGGIIVTILVGIAGAFVGGSSSRRRRCRFSIPPSEDFLPLGANYSFRINLTGPRVVAASPADASPRQPGYIAAQMQNILNLASAPC